MHPSTLVLPLLACAMALPSQQDHTVPQALHGTFGNASFYADQFTTVRAQVWHDAGHLPRNRLISAVGLAVAHDRVSAGQDWDYELTLDNSTIGFGQLSRNMQSNLGPSAQVVFKGTLKGPQQGPHNDPFKAIWIPITPFPFRGPHLLFDVTFRPKSKNTGNRYYFSALTMQQAPTYHQSSVQSCGGTLTASSSSTGSAHALTLRNAMPGRPVLFMLGGDNVGPRSNPLPLDLGRYGMPGCRLGLDPVVFLPGVADAQGTATIAAPFTPGAVASTVFAQAVHPTPNNPQGLATSNATNSVIGRTGLCNFVNDAGVGPFAYNIAPVTFLRFL